jgi:hypothetical protein
LVLLEADVKTLDDVVAAIPPEIFAAMTEDDVRDILLALHADPSCGPELLDAYKASVLTVSPPAWEKVWALLQEAAQIASVISSIGGAVGLATSL